MAGTTPEHKKYVVLFDGTCKLCNNVVRFITKNDSRQTFCFIPLESEKATEYFPLYEKENVKKGSMLLIEGEKLYLKSDAVFRILKRLDGLWPVLWVFIIVPKFIRDPVYDVIARYRYRLFGPCVDCPEPRSC